jgi:hypothetical protein
MKPILIIPPDQMSKEDIDRLRENDICVVEAKEPSEIRFVDPPPSGNYDQVVEASLALSRWVINNPTGTFEAKTLSAYWAQMLMGAHPIRKLQVEKTESLRNNETKAKRKP